MITKKAKQPAILAYGISHELKLILTFKSYLTANKAIETGMIDWAGTVEQFKALDKEVYEGYDTLYTIV
jgi:hypothetical protein